MLKPSVMKSYRDLEIYKESKRLAIEVNLKALQLPKFEMYEEGGQHAVLLNRLHP
jgi:hypothetical protein